MRIFAKKRFILRAGKDTIVTTPLAFADIDERFAHCRLFGLALADGDIEVIDSPVKQKSTENEPGEPTRGMKNAGKTSKDAETSPKPPTE